MAEDLTGKVNDWLDKTGYPLEMRLTSAFKSADLESGYWDVDSNQGYADPSTQIRRETDLDVVYSLYTELVSFTYHLIFECKSTTTPWVVFKRVKDGSGRRKNTLFSYEQNFGAIVEQGFGQLLPLLQALEVQLDDRVFDWPDPGYSIAEAFKQSNNERDPAHNALRQVMTATRAFATDVYRDPGDDRPEILSAAPIIVTTSPLFDAQLSTDGTHVVATRVSATSVRMHVDKIGAARVLIVNEDRVDDIIKDCLAIQRTYPEFLKICNPDLIRPGKGEFQIRLV